MILFENALEITLGEVLKTGTEQVPLANSLGRILASDICSDIDMPPFDKSAVDGFACRMQDLQDPLRVIETIPAGRVPEQKVGPGLCSKIMTGAMVPEGADCVIMVEDTQELNDDAIRFTGSKTAPNICRYAEDIQKGATVLQSGTLIQPQHIAVLASTGACNPKVAVRPRLSIISTGDELVTPDVIPGPAFIRDSNSHQLTAQVIKAGCIARNMGISPDAKELILETLLNSDDSSDVVILSGGVSMGDFDYVPTIFKMAGIELLYQKIAIQPGKPTVFGKKGRTFFFGLPGNPVSAFVLFEMLVKPFLYGMMGWTGSFPVIGSRMATDYTRKRSNRKSFIPVTFREGEIMPVEYHGSAHINAYSEANGIISMDIGETELKKGAFVNVRLI